MKSEIVKSKIVNQRILTADEGMYLTNGETRGKTVVLNAEADHSMWYEITEAEADRLFGGSDESEAI